MSSQEQPDQNAYVYVPFSRLRIVRRKDRFWELLTNFMDSYDTHSELEKSFLLACNFLGAYVCARALWGSKKMGKAEKIHPPIEAVKQKQNNCMRKKTV